MNDIFSCFSCNTPLLSDAYGEALKHKNRDYDIIMREVNMIVNFARFGWISFPNSTSLLLSALNWSIFSRNFSDPTIKCYTPFESCKSSSEIFCTEITNDPYSTITTDIKKQLHYETWRKVEKIYNNLPGAPDKFATMQKPAKCKRQKIVKKDRKLSKSTRKIVKNV